MRSNLKRVFNYILKSSKFPPSRKVPALFSVKQDNQINNFSHKYYKVTLGAATFSLIWLYAEMKKDDGNLKDGHAKTLHYDSLQNNERPKLTSAEITKHMVNTLVSPQILFFRGNPATPPYVDPEEYKLEIVREGEESKTYTLKELKALPISSVNATILCASNLEKNSQIEPIEGLCWTQARIGKAEWTGVKLSTILKHAGISNRSSTSYVKFESLAGTGTNNDYIPTVPLLTALDSKRDIMLAYEMNGEKLSRNNGFPLRVIIPTVDGAKNIKWLNKIVVGEDIVKIQSETDGILCPESGLVILNKDEVQEPIRHLCLPSDGDTIVINSDNTVSLKGYAWTGRGRGIVSIDLTTDQGETWHKADFVPKEIVQFPNKDKKKKEKEKKAPMETPEKKMENVNSLNWTTWEAKVPMPKNNMFETDIWVKVVDSSYVQKKNLKDVIMNAYDEIKQIFKLTTK